LAPSEINSLPAPVALLVVPIDPLGAVVVVVFAVMAVLKKYTPATALDAAASPLDTKLDAVTAPSADAPVTVRLSSWGSAYATPIGLLFAMIMSF
jgi:hypothetical protein